MTETKPVLFGPDGRRVDSEETEKPRLFDHKNEPVKRQIKAEDIEGFDQSKSQYLYAKTKDGGKLEHGNDAVFFARDEEIPEAELNGAKLIGRTSKPTPPPALQHRPVLPAEPRNRRERRAHEARIRKSR